MDRSDVFKENNFISKRRFHSMIWLHVSYAPQARFDVNMLPTLKGKQVDTFVANLVILDLFYELGCCFLGAYVTIKCFVPEVLSTCLPSKPGRRLRCTTKFEPLLCFLLSVRSKHTVLRYFQAMGVPKWRYKYMIFSVNVLR